MCPCTLCMGLVIYGYCEAVTPIRANICCCGVIYGWGPSDNIYAHGSYRIDHRIRSDAQDLPPRGVGGFLHREKGAGDWGLCGIGSGVLALLGGAGAARKLRHPRSHKAAAPCKGLSRGPFLRNQTACWRSQDSARPLLCRGIPLGKVEDPLGRPSCAG